MIKVCDAIMGSGKSSAAITLMNEHPDQKYIYITPYIEEAKRIRKSCPGLNLVEPKRKPEFHGSKTLHTIDLVKQDKNVSTTHQAFRHYPTELLDMIREKEYTLIIDESVNVFDNIDIHPDDMKMVIDSGHAVMDETGTISLVDSEYYGSYYKDLFNTMKTRDIVQIKWGLDKESYYYWLLPPDLFLAAPTTYILTYQFDGQDLSYLFKMYGIEYESIGVCRDELGTYRFTDGPGDLPEYVKDLPNKIHILENDKLNSIGDDNSSLSMNWYNKERGDVGQVKNNVYNFFNHMIRGVSSHDRMWGVYESAKTKVKGKGYSNGFVIWNERATNSYRHKRALAYCANVFMNVGHKLYFEANGVKVNEDMYALSILVQWIWRSAIRDGEEIFLYLPSSRMRSLLQQWIEDVSKGVRC